MKQLWEENRITPDLTFRDSFPSEFMLVATMNPWHRAESGYQKVETARQQFGLMMVIATMVTAVAAWKAGLVFRFEKQEGHW